MSKKETTITADEWLKAILPPVQQRPENSFTIREAMEVTNLKRTHLISLLEQKIKSGELVDKKIVYNGHITRFFIPKNGKFTL